MSLARKDKSPAGPTKTGTPVHAVVAPPELPLRFDPRWASCQPCQKRGETTPDPACVCMCHGGWRVALALRLVPRAEWSARLRTATCVLCGAVGGERTGGLNPICPCQGEAEAA